MHAKPQSSELRLDEVPVVRELFDVFFEDFLGLLPKCKIEFAIEV